ncbi:hypothetical protein CONCODRAFT_11748 [Conidiobolus coronatus NRRL 28638]|uniref:Centromere protein S n=1 Tax=Conidiobolus coronatus (strain ATCC 28846 / CBS 209.66 / NRRL 28638) TaxID=796925 RepID=A0A137NUM7_CONC2|nr:hypothetical protein CONCODRAFT_11748 [Conidiobolus coronatus NRRL 28638]|eukprot:KXN66422.1 hypothetical protein CONCODRAFT_11748 [Conidiobolus coronatus NRRL 28638]
MSNKTEANEVNLEEHLDQLKASIWLSVGKICDEEGKSNNFTTSTNFKTVLSQLVTEQLETFVKDLEMFSKHAKRSVINNDDIKLCLRRNPDLVNMSQ